MMNKGLMAAAAVLIGAGIAGYAWWQTMQGSGLPVGIALSNGRIEAERIEVATKIAGRVDEVFVAEGAWVEAGAVIARIETTELGARLRQAQAGILQAERQEDQAEALLQQRSAELALAQADFMRVEKLSTDGFAAAQKLDQQRAVLNTAQAGVAAAEAGIDLAKATIVAAQAAADEVQSSINDATLTAPRAGRVQYVLTHKGEVLAAGSTAVTLTDLSDMYMTIFLPTRDVGRLAIGAEARIILDPIPEYVIPATVTFVASTAQFTPKSVETEAERDQLMFRVKLTIDPALLAEYQDRARGGVPGVGYVRVDDSAQWPDELVVRLPK